MAKVNRKQQMQDNQHTEGQVDDQTEDQVEGGDAGAVESTANDDPFYAVFPVSARLVLNSAARNALEAEEVTFNVTRFRKGVYAASFVKAEGSDPIVGKESKKPDVAVKYAIKALGLREGEFMFDAFAAESEHAPIPETAGDNQPDVWFFDQESEITDRLHKVEDEVRAADALMTGAAKDAKAAWLGFGRAYNAAKAIFAEAGLSDEGEGAKRGNAAWGTWLRTRFAGSDNVAAILASKNAAAQAGFFATAPDDVVEASGAGTASTFSRKAEEAAADFGLRVASSVLAQRNADEDPDRVLTGPQAEAVAREKLAALEAGYASALAAWKAAAAKAAEKGKNVEPFKEAKLNGPLKLVRWMFDTAGSDFGASKLGRAVLKAWETEINKPSEAEVAAAETKKAVAVVSKRFADMATDDAAKHLLNMLVAHPEPELVLTALADMLVAWREQQEAAAADAMAAAEREASGE